MEIIKADAAPAAVGPYSHAVRAGDLLFCSGQIGLDPATNAMAGEDVGTQTRQVLRNLEAVLQAAGLDFGRVVKTTIFLTDMAHFPEVNRLYAEAMGEHRPARATVEVASLPLGALVEIECTAVFEC